VPSQNNACRYLRPRSVKSQEELLLGCETAGTIGWGESVVQNLVAGTARRAIMTSQFGRLLASRIIVPTTFPNPDKVRGTRLPSTLPDSDQAHNCPQRHFITQHLL
jgi:hypothetical protein